MTLSFTPVWFKRGIPELHPTVELLLAFLAEESSDFGNLKYSTS